MIKIIFIIICFLMTHYFLLTTTIAYTLPYPSYMPGHKMYNISKIIDKLKQYWYFGAISSVKYHTALADKYLVECKTLFEYGQYLLALDALKRSDNEFQQIKFHIANAAGEGKDMTTFAVSYGEQSKKHIELLNNLLQSVPETFTWTPEKADPTELPIHQLLLESLDIRNKAL